MKNINKVLTILLSICTVIVILTAKEYCLDHELWVILGGDPNAKPGDSSTVAPDDMQNRMENALITHPELFDLNDPEAQAILQKHGVSGGSAPASSASAPATSSDKGKSGKTQEAKKITVYFTDLYGHVIGSSQVTAGTTIADSQFPKSVEDVDGHSFDKWDYDGRVMTNDFIVRALYK